MRDPAAIAGRAGGAESAAVPARKMGASWAIVLAAGEGTRLSKLTTLDSGVAVPKQFCSLRGGESLLSETLARAAGVVATERVVTIVSRRHTEWWRPLLGAMPPANLVVQPENRGTANGVLLALLYVLDRDPDARIILLPCDHHVANEDVLGDALRQALAELRAHPSGIVLLGLSPEEADPDLGYIVPGPREGLVDTVDRFIEKPAPALAQALVAAGALWNAFIVVASGRALLRLFERRLPKIVLEMQAAVLPEDLTPGAGSAISELYRELPNIDFSRHVLQGAEAELRVLAVPACGWSDLGTPLRVARTLQTLPRWSPGAGDRSDSATGLLNLAARHAAQASTLGCREPPANRQMPVVRSLH